MTPGAMKAFVKCQFHEFVNAEDVSWRFAHGKLVQRSASVAPPR